MTTEMRVTCADCGEYLSKSELMSDTVNTENLQVCSTCGEGYTVCDVCGETIERRMEQLTVDGITYCPDCYDEEFAPCHVCEEMVHEHELCNVGGDVWLCHNCARDYVECSRCGVMVLYEDTTEVNGGDLYCHSCTDNYVYFCVECGEAILGDDTYTFDGNDYYCEECYEKHSVIQEYHSGHKEGLTFFRDEDTAMGRRMDFGEEELFFGMELEVDRTEGKEDSNLSKEDVAREVIDRLQYEFVHCENDGSLSNGFEIITQPMQIEMLQNRLKKSMKSIAEFMTDNGFRSHNTETCGLHFHVSRRAFGDDSMERMVNIVKVYTIMENLWDGFVKFSRRSEKNLERWAAQYNIDKTQDDTPVDIYQKLSGDCSRYRALNISNDATVEFRMFRGTLKPETILATLQLVYGVIAVAKTKDINEIVNIKTFKELIDEIYRLRGASIGEELKEYTKERHLYRD